jgi:hypothetical protein
MRDLPPVKAGLIEAMKSGVSGVRFETAGMPGAYCGTPAGATAKEGKSSIGVLARALADAVREALAGRGGAGK